MSSTISKTTDPAIFSEAIEDYIFFVFSVYAKLNSSTNIYDQNIIIPLKDYIICGDEKKFKHNFFCRKSENINISTIDPQQY